MELKKLKLRTANWKDCKQYWNWANDPDVRKSSYFSEPIPWEEHVKWFENKLNDPQSFLFIVTDNKDIPIGQVRFELSDKESEIHVSIDRKIRGRGYGTLIIDMGVKELVRQKKIKTIHAFIKLENEASVKAFKRSGFIELTVEDKKGYQSLHLVKKI